MPSRNYIASLKKHVRRQSTGCIVLKWLLLKTFWFCCRVTQVLKEAEETQEETARGYEIPFQTRYINKTMLCKPFGWFFFLRICGLQTYVLSEFQTPVQGKCQTTFTSFNQIGNSARRSSISLCTSCSHSVNCYIQVTYIVVI